MSYTINVPKNTKPFFTQSPDMVTVLDGHLEIRGKHLSEVRLKEFLDVYRAGLLVDLLDQATEHRFFFCIHDVEAHKLIVVNDKFGSNEIYHTHRNGEWMISDRVAPLFDGHEPAIDMQSLYETLFFYSVTPPRTIYQNISAVPMASMLSIDYGSGTSTVSRYWNIEGRFTPKNMDYDDHIAQIREPFFNALASETDATTGVSLSGGIDSGTLLAIATKVRGGPVTSITFGGHGKNTPDLVQGSRLTLKEYDSPNHEIFPSFDMLRRLPRYMADLDQPIDAHLVWPNAMIYEKGHDLGLTKLCYGFGAEMLLGNLKIARVYDRIKWFEWFVPRFLRNIVYRIIRPLFKFSRNQLDFLLSPSWTRRFIVARSPLFTREKRLDIYTALPSDFIERLDAELNEKIGTKRVDQGDRFVMMYLLDWVSYMQMRDFSAMGRQFGITPVCPFDTPLVAEALFKTPTKFRKLNSWSKQVLRDMYRPYISDRLYHREVNSLIVNYNNLFKGVEKYFIAYVRTSPLVMHMVNLDAFEEKFTQLPEPGLTLMRLVGIAVWYDTHWHKEGLKGFDDACLDAQRTHGA